MSEAAAYQWTPEQIAAYYAANPPPPVLEQFSLPQPPASITGGGIGGQGGAVGVHRGVAHAETR